MAITFIPNPNNLPCINHKDENKLNNRVDNLEWITVKDNDNYGTRNKRMSETKKKNPIVQLDFNGSVIAIHKGIKDAQKITGVNRNSIRDVCRGLRESAGGFKWKYYKEVKNDVRL